MGRAAATKASNFASPFPRVQNGMAAYGMERCYGAHVTFLRYDHRRLDLGASF